MKCGPDDARAQTRICIESDRSPDVLPAITGLLRSTGLRPSSLYGLAVADDRFQTVLTLPGLAWREAKALEQHFRAVDGVSAVHVKLGDLRPGARTDA